MTTKTKQDEVARIFAAFNNGQNIFRRPSVLILMKRIEELEARKAEALTAALDGIGGVQFCDNTYAQSVEAKKEVEAIIRKLVQNEQ
jgi:BMFP domain-containing protein YqiC